MEPIVWKLQHQELDVAKEGMVGLGETQKREVLVRVRSEAVEGNWKKKAEVSLEVPRGSTYIMFSDEGQYLGGKDEAPAPLCYFSAGIAF